MTIRNGLLALLRRGPSHGYQLRAELAAATASAWPLNVGQVYTTLARLERDGLVAQESADAEGRVVYRLTTAGDRAVDDWFAGTVDRRDRPRDELAIKLALALTTPGVDVAAVVQRQRVATVHAMQDLTRLKAGAGSSGGDDAWLLVVESMIFQAEAEVRWLDHCETRLVARARPRRAGADAPARGEAGTTGAGLAAGGADATVAAPDADPPAPAGARPGRAARGGRR